MLLNIQGVGSAVNKLNDVVAMIAEVRSLADALASTQKQANVDHQKAVRWMKTVTSSAKERHETRDFERE